MLHRWILHWQRRRRWDTPCAGRPAYFPSRNSMQNPALSCIHEKYRRNGCSPQQQGCGDSISLSEGTNPRSQFTTVVISRPTTCHRIFLLSHVRITTCFLHLCLCCCTECTPFCALHRQYAKPWKVRVAYARGVEVKLAWPTEAHSQPGLLAFAVLGRLICFWLSGGEIQTLALQWDLLTVYRAVTMSLHVSSFESLETSVTSTPRGDVEGFHSFIGSGHVT